MQIRNIGIFAHVDAGKTTLSEQLLVHSGAIRKLGSVDSGTAHTDNLPVERRRGISVKATCVRLNWKNTDIHLIDTPGHVDFSAEIERSFWALDGAVLVVCGVEGVQPQTETLFHALRAQGIPVVFFINKIDRESADIPRVMAQIRRRCSGEAALLGDVEALTDAVCSCDDEWMERYLEGEMFDGSELTEKARELSRLGRLYPVLTGSALKDQGIEPVLDAVVDCLPAPEEASGLSGVVFAKEQNKLLGMGAWVRLYGGTLENRETVTLPGARDPITGEERQVQMKITQIRAVDGGDSGVLRAGQIGIVYGLGDVAIGHVFGDETLLPRRVQPGLLRKPLMTVQVIPEKMEQMTALRTACETLSQEDPLLQAHFYRSLNQLHLHVMGAIQLEIIEETLRTRFELAVHFSDPAVIYRETVAGDAVGIAAYLMPKPCWAVIEVLIRPGERGSGVIYRSAVPGKDILPRYQHQIEQALPVALNQGRLGWTVTDVEITLIGGSHHQFHTHPLDFIVATPWAIQDALAHAENVLLEPILAVRFLLPPECVGRVMSDVALMRGEVVSTETDGERVTLDALVPVATSLSYSQELASLSGGRGSMNFAFHSYRECPLELGKTAARRGVDPLDTSRYILAARNALDNGIFDLE